jgi:excisionase family DNA binding protein
MPRGDHPSSSPQDHPGGDEELLTTREVMAFLNLSRTRIWELVKREQLPAFKVGGDYRYRRSEIDAWLERFRVNKAPVHHKSQK